MFDLLITDARLLDIETGKISEHNSVTVKGERIAKIFSGVSEGLNALQARSFVQTRKHIRNEC